MKARLKREWREDYGFVVWWKFPVCEPSWIGTPNDDDWPGYHTHWTPHPEIPDQHYEKEKRLERKWKDSVANNAE